MIDRIFTKQGIEYLNYFPCLAITGSRQVGKTTLSRQLAKHLSGTVEYIDLELPDDYRKLEDAYFYLSQFSHKTFVIDEVQRNKSLFPVLRGLIDQDRRPGRFVLLGSASPHLIRHSSESLAGRIAFLELPPFILPEVGFEYLDDLWLRGGYPDVFLQNTPFHLWMQSFIKTYLERDLPQLGLSGTPSLIGRLWSMLAHQHGDLINYSQTGRSLAITGPTVKSNIDFLESAYMIRQLQPWSVNIGKRLVKSPKVFIRDAGILHYLLGVGSFEKLLGHYKVGSSWEGFVIEQIMACTDPAAHFWFYRTHEGAELDLLIEKGGVIEVAIEIKLGSDSTPTRGNVEALKTVKPLSAFLINHGTMDYLHSSGFRICGLTDYLQKYCNRF